MMTIYARSVYGWGKGDTLAEALKNLVRYSRGGIKVGKDFLDALAEDVFVFASDDPAFDTGSFGEPIVHEGYTFVSLGDKYNEAKIMHGPLNCGEKTEAAH